MIKQCIVNEIHRAARKNFLRRSVLLKGIDDLWQADLIDIKKINRFNNGYNYILVVIDCFSKYAWAVPIKTKTKCEVSSAFAKILKENHRCPVNLQTDMGTEFYNNVFKKITTDFKINHYSTFSTKKASIVERFIRTLKSKLYKSFNMNGNYKWVGKVIKDVMVEYNNTMHRTIKHKPADVNHSVEMIIRSILNKSMNNQIKRKPKLKIGDYVRVSKYKNSFQKGYTPNWSNEIFVIKKVNNTNPVTYYIEDRRNQPILGCFYEQELQKTNYPDVYLIEKVIKKRGNKLFVKWLGLSNEDNSWVDKKELIN